MNEKFISTAKKIKNKISSLRFDLYHKYSAIDSLKDVVAIKGKTDPKLIKLSNEYAIDVLGWKGYAPWLIVYSAFAETFKEGWIPDNYYGKIVIPKIQGDYGKLSFLKSITYKIFDTDVFPDIGYFANGLFYKNNFEIIQSNEIIDFLFKKSNKIVFKLDHSMQGLGVYFFEKDSFDIHKISSLGNGVFQEFIEQHAVFNEFMPSSVATIRITTVIDNQGKPSVRACFLRLGQKNDTHVNSVSDLGIPINLKTGEFDAHGYDNYWGAMVKHPDTQVLFANKIIPQFDKCLSTALELQKSMPLVRCIGWDMIVDKNEKIKVMEWNGYDTDIKFSEATQGPCFKDLGWEKLWKK